MRLLSPLVVLDDEAFAAEGKEANLNQIEALCRGEMAATESYARASACPALMGVVDALRRVQGSHQYRVDLLIERIHQLGGEPPASSGAWGSLVSLLEGAALGVSESMAVAVLARGEEHGLAQYQRELDLLDPDTRDLVAELILPRQHETNDAMIELRRRYA